MTDTNGEVEETASPETVEPKQVFEPRQAEPNQVFGYTDRDGSQATVKANKEGVVRPQNVDQARALDAFGLPTAKTKKAEEG